MSDYGSSGMNRTVVLGQASHTVYYNVTGNNTTSTLQAAIVKALGSNTGIIENNTLSMELSVFPNPVTNNVKIAYTLNQSADVSITVLNVLGEKVNTIYLGTQAAGKQEYQLNVGSLSKGIFFIKLNAGEATETTKISVVH